MSANPKKGFVSSTLSYKGGIGHWSWILHRLGGLGIAFFLILHILDIFMVGVSKEVFEELLFIYHEPLLRPVIWALVFGVFYHALNGLRIIIQDFWPHMFRYQKQLATTVWVIVIVLTVFLVGVDIVGMMA